MITLLAPTSDSNVRSIKSSRACTSTWSHTSSGARCSSISLRLKANSVFEADGNPTSISLKPHFNSVWKSSSFWLTFIGTASAWLPSRRSTLHQMGAWASTRSGHCRSGNSTGVNGRYFGDGSFSITTSWLWRRSLYLGKTKPHRRVAVGSRKSGTIESEPNCRASRQQRVQQQLKVQTAHHGVTGSRFATARQFVFCCSSQAGFGILTAENHETYERPNCRAVRRGDRLRWKAESAGHLRHHRDPATACSASAMLGRPPGRFQPCRGRAAQGQDEFCG